MSTPVKRSSMLSFRSPIIKHESDPNAQEKKQLKNEIQELERLKKNYELYTKYKAKVYFLLKFNSILIM